MSAYAVCPRCEEHVIPENETGVITLRCSHGHLIETIADDLVYPLDPLSRRCDEHNQDDCPLCTEVRP